MSKIRQLFYQVGLADKGEEEWRSELENILEKCSTSLKELKDLEENANALMSEPFSPIKIHDEFDLRQKCHELFNSSSGVGFVEEGELVESVVRILRTSLKEAMGEDLLGLLGYEAFDFCTDLLANSEKYLESFISIRKTKGIKIVDTGNDKRGKAPKKTTRPLEYVPEMSAEDYPFVYNAGAKLNYIDAKTSLPEGTIRDNQLKYEEFVIPYSTTRMTEKAQGIRIVNPGEKDPFLKEAFVGYKSLNRMQSACFPIAYGSTENMLVCAPTGAGKTDIAMLTVLNCLKEHIVDDKGSIDLDAFKIIYVAPMKALATEIVSKFSTRLKAYGVSVRECTGDTQLTRSQVNSTQMLVTTPEKWDVLSRKGLGDVDLVAKVKLLIIDEVHLLHDDRGPVLESIVARTLRQVEMSQAMIRIVGLSATLPNYLDVAIFLRVNPWRGMFYFDGSFRPVPLTQSFVGVKGRNPGQVRQETERICYERMCENIKGGHQVMVFVHSRNDTVKTARTLLRMAQEDNFNISLNITQETAWNLANRQVQKSRNAEIRELFIKGIGVHHAGMVKADRLLMERMFTQGHLSVLVCTSTLAWGVNLPVHAVIIKGTLVYSAEKGDFAHIGILDVMQIFGRAGRPQFETHGEGTLISTHEQLFHYLRALCSSTPIESRFMHNLMDNLNAEIVLGTVSNVEEACAWLGYTYFYVRLHRNPLVYGINGEDSQEPDFDSKYLLKAVEGACAQLHHCGMIGWHQPSGVIKSKPLGRIASHFYLRHETVELFSKYLNPQMIEEHILELVCRSAEFDSIRVREEEMMELGELRELVSLRIRGDETSVPFKINILVQCHISRYTPQAFSLISDLNYLTQNVGRILRALFEITLGMNYGLLARRCLDFCKSFERQRWMFEHPMTQIEVPDSEQIPWEKLRMEDDLTQRDVEGIVRNKARSHQVYHALKQFPRVKLSAVIEPVSASILQISYKYTADFEWNNRVHGSRQVFWLMLENVDASTLLHNEQIVISPQQLYEEQVGQFYIPKPEESQLVLRLFSDSFLQGETLCTIKLSGLKMPEDGRVYTELLPLRPLPITSLGNSALIAYYANKFKYFNPVQTQVFHTLYHLTEESTLVGAPTGSGKTVLAELAIFGSLRDHPDGLVVYIAPLKALVRERMIDWALGLPKSISLHELSGDVVTDYAALKKASMVVATPEKWDAVTRNWRKLSFVQRTQCIIMDEIHLLGSDRGHVLEAIVSRFHGECRFVGLSTALANALDFAKWLGIKREFVYGFKASVRPVPVTVRMEGFPGRHYCPRMAAMNKPIFQAILKDAGREAGNPPVLVFVSSRRQTRLTAQALISLCAMSGITFMNSVGQSELVCVEDETLRFCLPFGITVHHAGLSDVDRRLSERLFLEKKVQVMIATSTVAWGVNFPARLVIVKGCEYYCAKRGGYVPFPITDVMQMIGRAGRPQFDTQAQAVVLVEEARKSFYKRFLYDPFPAESNLREGIADHLNAEIASTKRIETFEDARCWLETTFLAIRLNSNPSFYHTTVEEILNKAFVELLESKCISLVEGKYVATEFGMIASNYYLRHETIRCWLEGFGSEDSSEYILRLLSLSPEFSDFSFRHNEDQETVDLLRQLQHLPNLKEFNVYMRGVTMGSVHDKVFALLLAWIGGADVMLTDWRVDQASLLDQVGRVMTGMIHFYIATFSLVSSVNAIKAFQMINACDNKVDLQLKLVGRRIQIQSKMEICIWLVYSKDDSLIEAKKKTIRGEYAEEAPKNATQLLVMPEGTAQHFKLTFKCASSH